MKTLWQKLNYLVPEPQCRTTKNTIFDWTDARQQPPQVEIDAVTDQQVEDGELDKEANNSLAVSKKGMLLFEINFDQEKRIRVLEGKPTVTKQQYKTVIKNLYKTL